MNVPQVATLAELNAMVDRWDAADDARRIGTRPRTVGEHFAIERPLLEPLPTEPFETGLHLALRVDATPGSACAPTATRYQHG